MFEKFNKEVKSEFISELEASEITGLKVNKLINLYRAGNLQGAEIIKGRYCFFRKDIYQLLNRECNQQLESQLNDDFLLKQVISKDRILFKNKSNKELILKEMSELLADSPVQCSKEIIEQGIFRREALMSTGMGLGIAIPHVRLSSATDIAVAVALVKEGIYDYGSIDNQPIFLFFMIVGRTDQHDQHLKIVSQLSLKLKQKNYFTRLCNISTSSEFYSVITE